MCIHRSGYKGYIAHKGPPGISSLEGAHVPRVGKIWYLLTLCYYSPLSSHSLKFSARIPRKEQIGEQRGCCFRMMPAAPGITTPSPHSPSL